MKILGGAVIAPIAAAIICYSATGMAQDRNDGWYASVSGLVVGPNDATWTEPGDSVEIDMKTGFGFLAAFGRSLPSGLRTELELGYREYDFGRGEEFEFRGQFSTVSLMVNGIFSVDLQGFRPYAGLGIGLAQHTAEIESVTAASDGGRVFGPDTGEANVFAYQGMAGIGYPLSDRTEVSLGYRYFGSAEGDFGSSIRISSANHNFEVGLLYRF